MTKEELIVLIRRKLSQVPRILFDIDGTLLNTDFHLYPAANKRFNLELKAQHYHEGGNDYQRIWGGVSYEELRDFFRDFYHEYGRHLLPHEGAQEVVAKLIERGYVLDTCTYRSPGIEEITHGNLGENFPGAFGLVDHLGHPLDGPKIVLTPKSQRCREGNFSLMLEDSPSNSEDCAKGDTPAILFDWGRSYRYGDIHPLVLPVHDGWAEADYVIFG